MPKNKWEKIRNGRYSSIDGKWQIERRHERRTTSSSQREWILVDTTNGDYKPMKIKFTTMKAAQKYSETANF